MSEEEKTKLLTEKEAQDTYDQKIAETKKTYDDEIAKGTKIFDDTITSLPKQGEIYIRLAKAATSYFSPSLSMKQIDQVLEEAKKEFPGPTILHVARNKRLGEYTEINYSKEQVDAWFKKWFGSASAQL